MDRKSEIGLREKDSPALTKSVDNEVSFSTRMSSTTKNELEELVETIPYFESQRNAIEILIDRCYHSNEFKQYERLRNLTKLRSKQVKKNCTISPPQIPI